MRDLCSSPGCQDYPVSRGRCAAHGDDWRWVYKTRRWRSVRHECLVGNPTCQIREACDAMATEVDHIVPLSEGGEPFDLENLQSACKSCHAVKTRREANERVPK
jgi:5-methylcytosine-specific restriction endonuclease McrA